MGKKISFVLACAALSLSLGCEDGVSALVGSVCMPGEMKCENGTAKVCYGINWQETECPNGCDDQGKTCKILDGAECAIDTCADNTDDTLKRCVNGKYVTEKCPGDKPLCQGSKCVAHASCTPDTVECTADRTGIRTCSAEGMWGDPTACGDGKACDVVKLECVAKDDAAQCKADTIKCADRESAPNTYMTCKDGKWSEKAAACDAATPICEGKDGMAKCIAAPVNPENECKTGEIKCSDDLSSTIECKDGKWADPAACGDKKKCDVNELKCVDEKEAAECRKDEVKCSDDLSSTIACKDGKWDAPAACGDKKKCDVNELKCVDEDTVSECRAGEVKCSDSLDGTITCSDKGKWGSVVKCGKDRKCDADKKICVDDSPAAPDTCTPGALKCSDDRTGTQKCGSNKKWSSTIEKCKNGQVCDPARNACTDKPVIPDTGCTAGTIKCSDDLTGTAVCGEDGKWGTAKSCGTGKVCNPVSKKCIDKPVTDVCTDGTAKCLDKSSYVTCVNGQWDASVKVCDGVCAAINAVDTCAECIPGSMQCTADSLGIQTCSPEGKWNVSEACPENKVCDAKRNACSCKTGQTYCSANGDFMICKDGIYVTAAQCGEKTACKEITGCDCTIGDTKCNEAGTGIMTCSANTDNGLPYNSWQETLCDTNKCIDKGNARCSKCEDGTTRCMGAMIQTCQDGKWGESVKCEIENQTCDADLSKCVDPCTIGETRCTDDGAFWICSPRLNGATWVKSAECGEKKLCNADASGTQVLGCVCTTGASKCDKEETSTMTCIENQSLIPSPDTKKPISYRSWDVTLCQNGECQMNNNTAACVCPDGDKRCTGTELQECREGKWISVQKCSPLEERCDDSIGACVKNQCVSNVKNGIVFHEMKCSGNKLLKCQDGQFVVSDVCENGCVMVSDIFIKTAECSNEKKCKENSRRCSNDMKTVEICDKNGEWKKAKGNDGCKKDEVCVMRKEGLKPAVPTCEKTACEELAKGCSEDLSKITMCINNTNNEIATCAKDYICDEGECVLQE